MRGGESVEAQIRRAQRGSAVAGADANVQRMVGQYIDRNYASIFRDFALIKEKVETLTAERGNPGDAAVRRSQLGRLSQIPAATSAHADAAPTQAEFNALVDDVHAIGTQLFAIADLLARLSR